MTFPKIIDQLYDEVAYLNYDAPNKPPKGCLRWAAYEFLLYVFYHGDIPKKSQHVATVVHRLETLYWWEKFIAEKPLPEEDYLHNWPVICDHIIEYKKRLMAYLEERVNAA